MPEIKYEWWGNEKKQSFSSVQIIMRGLCFCNVLFCIIRLFACIQWMVLNINSPSDITHTHTHTQYKQNINRCRFNSFPAPSSPPSSSSRWFLFKQPKIKMRYTILLPFVFIHLLNVHSVVCFAFLHFVFECCTFFFFFCFFYRSSTILNFFSFFRFAVVYSVYLCYA